MAILAAVLPGACIQRRHRNSRKGGLHTPRRGGLHSPGLSLQSAFSHLADSCPSPSLPAKLPECNPAPDSVCNVPLTLTFTWLTSPPLLGPAYLSCLQRTPPPKLPAFLPHLTWSFPNMATGKHLPVVAPLGAKTVQAKTLTY